MIFWQIGAESCSFQEFFSERFTFRQNDHGGLKHQIMYYRILKKSISAFTHYVMTKVYTWSLLQDNYSYCDCVVISIKFNFYDSIIETTNCHCMMWGLSRIQNKVRVTRTFCTGTGNRKYLIYSTCALTIRLLGFIGNLCFYLKQNQFVHIILEYYLLNVKLFSNSLPHPNPGNFRQCNPITICF